MMAGQASGIILTIPDAILVLLVSAQASAGCRSPIKSGGIGEYLATEGTCLDVGSPVALIENYWAFMTLKANGKGILRKTFFEPGTSVKIGDPIAVVGADGEDLPYGKNSAVVEIVERKREKPTR